MESWNEDRKLGQFGGRLECKNCVITKHMRTTHILSDAYHKLYNYAAWFTSPGQGEGRASEGWALTFFW